MLRSDHAGGGYGVLSSRVVDSPQGGALPDQLSRGLHRPAGDHQLQGCWVRVRERHHHQVVHLRHHIGVDEPQDRVVRAVVHGSVHGDLHCECLERG